MNTIEQVREYLASYGLADRIIETERSSETVEAAAAALGCEPGRIAKSLAFMAGEKPVIVLAKGDARVDNKKYKAVFQTKAKMIPFDWVEEVIGHAPGGVCPFAIRDGIDVYMDESLRLYDIVYPAAGNDHSAVRLTLEELEKASRAIGWVDVCKE